MKHYSCTPDQDFHVFVHMRKFYLRYPITAHGKDKKTNSGIPAACWPHVNLCHCNVKMMSPCHIYATSQRIQELLKAFFMLFSLKTVFNVSEKKSNYSSPAITICHPLASLLMPLLIPGKDFSIPPSHLCRFL